MIKIDIVTNRIRNYFVGKDQKFIFEKVDIESFELPNIHETNLYIHIPFCKSMCPYCPYNRVLYQEEMIGSYITALLKEIEIYAQKLGRVTISSVYIGGGTPTNVIDELEDVIDKIKTCFNVVGDIAIETTIADINEYNVQKLKSYGINMISIGVQSFDEKYLKLLGRNYT
ncbi:MAG: radical SAM protein, partial [Clostridiales bacterium]|nr:radical SAM protein [Clostridiales bacterium]